MRFLVTFAIVAAATALPRKPTKDFPKKFDSALDGLKDTYGTYDVARAPDEDLVVPFGNPFLHILLPPSSYDAYYEKQPEDPILPPEESSYASAGQGEETEGDSLIPPPEDTYSAHDGSGHLDLVPPPLNPEEPEAPKTYVAYEGDGQESLVPPGLSSYAERPSDKTGADVLASLASMVHSIPKPSSSYESYDPNVTGVDAPNAPSLVLLPPRADEVPEPNHSSYVEVTDDHPSFTPEQIAAFQDSLIPIPAEDLLPPSL